MVKTNNTKAELYPGEEIKLIDGYPSLIKFIPGQLKKPLVVFIPGNSHLARISYGFPNGNEKDFLSYWFHKKGYPFLAISYPLGNPVFDRDYPEYTVKDWSKSIIYAATESITQYHLPKTIIVVAWSMGGELAPTLNQYAKENNIKIKLFVGLSASPPIYNLLPKGDFFENLKPTESGLADTQPFSKFFLTMLDGQNKINKHTMIPTQIYLSQFIGNCPINIMGTALRYKDEKFHYDLLGAIDDTGAINVDSYPPIAIIHGSISKDLNFTIFSKYDWGSIITRYYYNKLETCAMKNPSKLKRAIDMIKKSPNSLVGEVNGNHFFFVGEYGAEHTAEEVLNMIEASEKLTNKINEICGYN